MYSLLIDTYVKDKEQKEFLFNAIENLPGELLVRKDTLNEERKIRQLQNYVLFGYSFEAPRPPLSQMLMVITMIHAPWALITGYFGRLKNREEIEDGSFYIGLMVPIERKCGCWWLQFLHP